MATQGDMVVGAMTRDTRDKLIIVALILFGILAFVTIWIRPNLDTLMAGLVASIVAGMFGIYKGIVSPDSASPTASVTSSTETTTKETVSDPKGAPANGS